METKPLHKYYYLNCIADNCRLRILINGFPLEDCVIVRPENTLSILNEYLTGRHNELVFEIAPAPSSSSYGEEQASPELKGGLKLFYEGEIVTPEDGVVISLEKLEESRKRKVDSVEIGDAPLKDGRIVLRYLFDNEDFDFSGLFVGPPVQIEDDDLVDYAMRLVKLFEGKDVDGFMQEYEYKYNDLKIAFGPKADDESSLKAMMAEAMDLALEKSPSRQDIEIRRWANDRLVELSVKGERFLIATNAGEDGVSTELPVFVSITEGKLRIVR